MLSWSYSIYALDEIKSNHSYWSIMNKNNEDPYANLIFLVIFCSIIVFAIMVIMIVITVMLTKSKDIKVSSTHYAYILL